MKIKDAENDSIPINLKIQLINGARCHVDHAVYNTLFHSHYICTYAYTKFIKHDLHFFNVFTYDFTVANGEWGCWGPYSECSATCGNGTKTRARKCNNPPPSGGGSSCIGDMEEIKTCYAGYCPSECIEQTI